MAELKDRVRFGAYWLLKRLAKGGMAEIYLACPAAPGREHERLVIKKLLEQYSQEEEFLSLFLQEAKLASQLSHPNVVRIFELGQEGGHLFMAMEYIEGHDLELLIRARRRWLSPVVAAYVAREVCEALSYAHQAVDLNGRPMNIVHRDVTPENVMIDAQGVVKLVDFGVARASARLTTTRPGVVRGKVSHMAPEHIKGKDLDGRADLFALGATLFELTTGIKPFERGQHAPSMWAVLHEDPPAPVDILPNYPRALSDIVMRSLEKDPDRRYRTAGDMRAALDRFLASSGEQVDASTLKALVEAQPAEFPRERAEDSSDPDHPVEQDGEGPEPRTQIGSSAPAGDDRDRETQPKTQIGSSASAGDRDRETQPKTQIGAPLLRQGTILDEGPDDPNEPRTQTHPGPGGPPRPQAAPPVLFQASEAPRPGPPVLMPAIEPPRLAPPVLLSSRERSGPPLPSLGESLEEDTTTSGAKPGRPRGILEEEEEHNPSTVRLKPLAEQEADRRMAAAVAVAAAPAIADEPEPEPEREQEPEPEPYPAEEPAFPEPVPDLPDDVDPALLREETRLTAVPAADSTRVTSSPSLLAVADGQVRVPTQSLDVAATLGTQPPRRQRHPTGDSAWDEATPPRGIAAARQEADEADAAVAAEQKSAAGTVFGGLFKGLLIVALMGAAGVATRVVTVLEYRKRLADQAEQFNQQIQQLQDPGKKAEPQAEPQAKAPPPAAATTVGDAGIAVAGDGGTAAASPSGDAGQAAADGGRTDGGRTNGDAGAGAAADADADAGAAEAGSDAGTVFKKGFGVISVKGRGLVYIDDKPCKLPCAVKLPSGEHVVRTSGKKPVEKRVPLQAGARETVKF
ncbi:MAG TPA: serine/threonine-protein kinase [Myxococcales bacterium]|jgi:serine/threonine protein kinase